MGISEREHHIKVLENLLKEIKGKIELYSENKNIDLRKEKEIVEALGYAISSLKTDEVYQIMYEGEEIYTKADMLAMLKKLEYEIYHALCHEIHGKENCPCTNQTTSCLATFRVCDADRAIGKVIQQKINKLKENTDGNK